MEDNPLIPPVKTGYIPVFRRSTRKIPTFQSAPFSYCRSESSFFPGFTAKIRCPFWAFFIDKNFWICYNNSTL